MHSSSNTNLSGSRRIRTPTLNSSQLLVKRLRKLTEDTEVFLVESPHNNYQPEPPEGFFAIRSHKRRVFLPMDGGKMPSPITVQSRLDTGEFVSVPLDYVKMLHND